MTTPSEASEALNFEPAAHYDRVIEIWRLLLGDDLHYGVFTNGDESLAEATGELTNRMALASRFEPGQRVLDVGCGNGTPAFHLVRTYGASVLGITTSAVGVATAEERAREEGLADNARFEVRDGTNNGLPDASFDRVWVLESSHLMKERDRLMSECARVLRPGGRMALCDVMRHRDIPFMEVRERREDFATLRAAFGEARMDPMASYVSLAEANGLQVDVQEDLTQLSLPTFDRWRNNAETFRAEALEAIGQQGLDDFVRGCDILEGFWRDGTFGYGLIAARKPLP